MKRNMVILASLLLTTCAVADEPKPGPLSEQEAAEGWIALFDGKTAFGWTSPNESKWTIVGGMLAPQKEKPGFLVTTTPFRSYDLHVDFQQSATGSMTILPYCDREGKPQRPLPQERAVAMGAGRWRYDLSVRDGMVVHTRLEQGGLVGGFVEESKTAPGPNEAGEKPRFGHLALKGSGFIIHSFKLRPVEMRALLNGKDLDGWKEHPGRKSKFSVTKEGWLSVKDGPGDLQTSGEWADFVLQAECKTNGKGLNSGIFFRCLPGQYQMGYEAQIHNGFGPPKEYTLEVFDPRTNKLAERKKEKYTAVDYGTGAIYRRQPARFQAAKDNEWFTMTVVAQGRHMATWVNGVQVVDWTDNRPIEEHARKGAYLKKGPISIQGHDPTTDLLFRNIRIAELPAR